jgi:KamA family protein
MTTTTETNRFRVYTRKNMDDIPQIRALPESERVAMSAVSAVLPFRVNQYVVDELIKWSDVPNDPMFQLTFPQPEMLAPEDVSHMTELVGTGASADVVKAAARGIQRRLNPHPAGQKELNAPHLGEDVVPGVQHKYRETALFFPSAGQTCHAYCTYCFRWAQFVGLDDLKFASKEADTLVRYLKAHPEIRSVLITGGDPMVMKTKVLRRFIEPLLDPKLSHIESIRFGSKALAYWPFRFTTDDDADDLMRLFEEVREAGKHVAFMAHYSHPRELETTEAQAAARRVLSAGAVIRCQAPLIRHVNDASEVWSRMWRMQTRLGMVPYYMFVERDTGAARYFEVPLSRAHRIFNDAYSRVSGLARTVRGPSMSATPGKVVIDGITKINGEKVFALRFLQGRDPDWVGKPFFAQFDDEAMWLDDLEPAFGQTEFFFEAGMRKILRDAQGPRRGLHLLNASNGRAASTGA